MKHGRTEDETEDSMSFKRSKSEKSLGIQLHPLLEGSSTGSLVSKTDNLTLNEVKTRPNPYLSHQSTNTTTNKRIAFLDKRLPVAPVQSAPASKLRFKTPGYYAQKAEEARQAALARQLQREIAQLAKDTLDTDLVKDLIESQQQREEETVNDWWDLPYLLGDGKINFDLLGNLIQRPSLKNYNSNNDTKGTLNIYLTREERKKLRRQRRLEAQKDLQEQIALGLLPPPPPKVKLSSLPRMLAQPGNQLGNESVQDPTRLAAEIKAQSEARLAAHQAANQQRALTPEERAAKQYRKYAELDAQSVHVAVFKLADRLDDGAIRFKVLKNAEQNHLRGRVFVGPEFSLLIAEGGPKGIKRYCHLLEERMLKQTFPGWAQLIWRGEQPEWSPALKEDRIFKMIKCDAEFDAEEAVKALGFESYWIQCKHRQ